MSRELKFRSWNLETKFMYNNIEDGVVAKNQKGEFVLGISFGAICRDLNSIVMQFTGLKDKNGKEIYEYDFIKYKISNQLLDNSTTDKIEVVEWNNVGWNLNTYKEYEVIGNIYETPELL